MNVLILYANRAEKSILDPIVSELHNKNINYEYINLSTVIEDLDNDKNLSKIYDFIYNYSNDISFGIVIGDRREIMFATLALFVRNIPFYQMASGDLSEKITLVDDYFRHLVTIISSKQICFSKNSLHLTNTLLDIMNIKQESKYLPNPTLSNIDIDSLKNTISEKYDLILMHPQSLSYEGTLKDKEELLKVIDDSKLKIIIRGNKDKNYEVYYDLWEKFKNNKKYIVYDNLEKRNFFSLLKYTDKFITNSSCSYYEAPIFLEESKIIRIGGRNDKREIVNYNREEINSAEKIVNFMLGDNR